MAIELMPTIRKYLFFDLSDRIDTIRLMHEKHLVPMVHLNHHFLADLQIVRDSIEKIPDFYTPKQMEKTLIFENEHY